MIKGIKLDNNKETKLEDFSETKTNLPKPIQEIIKPYNKKSIDFNSYGVYAINNYLRYSYFDRIEGHDETISQLLRSTFGKAVHDMLLDKFDVKKNCKTRI